MTDTELPDTARVTEPELPDTARVPHAQPDLPVLRVPADGVPRVTATPAELAAACERIAAGHGPVAVDAERASGHRYGQRAFLVQLRREGAGTFLVDPVAVPDLAELGRVLSGPEWILHSATQDLPCLTELGLRPRALFDTELAGRLLGLPRVGLAGLAEDLLGVRLAKGHGAADWSKRPLPQDWLAYAALDVELLEELELDLVERLHRAGRLAWAEQEFAALLDWQPKVRSDPWRRTSGLHRVRDPRGLAVVRELWNSREELARRWDRPPGRVLPDAALIAAARHPPATAAELDGLEEFARYHRTRQVWWDAIERALALPAADLPTRVPEDSPPPPRVWERRNPLAARRLAAVRAAVKHESDALAISPEVLVSPEAVRALVWDAGATPPDITEVSEALTQAGVRPWQEAIVTPVITAALQE